MSGILEKNLFYINKLNPSLCKKVIGVESFTCNFDVKPNLAGEYNLIIEGKAVHSIAGAEQEVRELFSSLPHNTDNSIHVIYGLGLGYLPDVFSENAKGSIILYEDNIEALRLVMEAVDFSHLFETGKFYLSSDIDEFNTILETVFRYKSKVSLTALSYHKLQCAEAFQLFNDSLQKLFELFDFNFSYQVNESYGFLKSTLTDLDKKYKCPLLTDYKDIYKGKPAIIVSAGPSLAKNIDVLKENKDNALIFCVGTALRTLNKNGIVPDFLNVIERYNTSVHYNLPCTKDIILITEAFTQSGVFEPEFKKHLLTASLENDSSRWFLEKAEKEFVEFETKGTVSYHALSCAKFFGCSPIILIGQDLAYTDGKCYAEGSAFDGLECVFDDRTNQYKIWPKDFDKFRDAYYSTHDWPLEYKNEKLNIKLEELNTLMRFVDGQNGEKMPTNPGYYLYIEYINEFAKRHGSDLKLINSSLGGALLEGFETISLSETFEKYAPVSLNKNNLLNSTSFETQFDSERVVKNINKDINELKTLLPLIQTGLPVVDKLKNKIALTKKYTPEISMLLSKAADIYVNVTNNYTNNNRLLKVIAMKEHNELSFIMKDAKEKPDFEDAKKLYELLNAYFVNLSGKVKETITELEKTIEAMK